MFCLRAWTPLLIFLTNASPIYVLLFLTATYALQRPCVYCSILLFVLVYSLFDFNADWFEPRWNPTPSNTSGAASGVPPFAGNATITDSILETASLALSVLNGTGTSLANAAADGVKRRVESVGMRMDLSGNGSAFEWLRSILEKKQFRIPCVDVIVRL